MWARVHGTDVLLFITGDRVLGYFAVKFPLAAGITPDVSEPESHQKRGRMTDAHFTLEPRWRGRVLDIELDGRPHCGSTNLHTKKDRA